MAIKIKNKEKLFICSDIHFGHERIIKLADRRNDKGDLFKDVDEMNEYIIEKWNEIVPEDAIVIDLGDFMFRAKTDDIVKIIKRLNFKTLHMIKGNHGRQIYSKLGDIGRKVVVHEQDIVHLLVDDEEFDDNVCEFQLCHYPIYEVPRAFKGALHLFGHTHKDENFKKNSLHVGIDTWKLRPASYFEVLTRLYLRAAKAELWS